MPRMTNWDERQWFSIMYDAQMARISGYDEHGGEHWKEIPVAQWPKQEGGTYRERREEAVLEIQDAIESGHQPGEVKE